MPRRLRRHLDNDRLQLEDLLARAFRREGEIDHLTYAEFRTALFRHIAIEETLLIPAAESVRASKALPTADQLRRDHLALRALLLPPPTLVILTAIRAILVAHGVREARAGGLYQICEALPGPQAQAILARLSEMPDPAAPRHVSGRKVMDTVRRALTRAGYDLRNYEPG
ncbi:MAG TPA: hypothetical protein VLI07_15920 [Candidatus Binatus sp.]|nr:hypothetical protein [Candidatus Binatus sp.]